ncbi:LysR family transcriptional regulator [Serratia liquefaciens]|jgi:DNA-binding transcriptional LysR family regulator|uniref:LysR family transcriptional regulator n=1 Tax=Serratia liquefaciens TaxID=614 RepID=UPI0003585142|nr:LysR family transcriptional regulator [Serratia liquefaciens]AGQ31860.1 transcriptional regulator [Serratia liquefaciens ATCC 27592]CAI0737596.1 D-malate degradation protein R [Serratia liquefaciens]CAI2051170.1 D-malate degradation protein R [Serratia liquefaciens]CAI2419372.1 D-malate degradation protein R [Serratia liquefaciens]HBL6729473.1 LysR family transcriptional regulator [Serratia liquefaciens]
MDRLDELAIFVAVVQHGSLAAAGRKLRRSASAVTRAIASLEQRFGARLVERTTRRLAPTEAGLRLAERAHLLLTDYQAAVLDTADTQLTGLLRITSPVQFGRKHVAPVVMAFLDRYPQMQIEMVLNDRNLDLIDEGLDVAVRIGHLQDSSRVARRLGQVSRVTVASPDYLARRGEPQEPAQLAEHDTIVGTQRASLREWRFGPQENGERVRLTPRLLLNDVETQLLAVRAGKGIARLLSYQVADDLAAGTLVRLLPAFEPLPMPVQLVAQNMQRMPLKVRTFWDYAWQELSQLAQIQAR